MKWLNLGDNVNLLSIIGAIIVVLCTVFVVGLYTKRMKEKSSGGELSQESWDNIKEYKNPIPIGWAVTFLVLIVWAIWYFLFGYPLNSYSQIGEYNQEVKAFDTRFDDKFNSLNHDELLAMGESVFITYCAACHGDLGNGNNGIAANLEVWGTEQGIINTIKDGSKGLNYPFGEMPAGLVDSEQAKAIAAYVAKDISGIKKTNNENLVLKGKELYDMNCAACHGVDGKGMDSQAANLTLYGTPKFVEIVLQRGKNGFLGKMPSFNYGRLNSIQKRAVANYVISLSK